MEEVDMAASSLMAANVVMQKTPNYYTQIKLEEEFH
jgi:hypothetical protein